MEVKNPRRIRVTIEIEIDEAEHGTRTKDHVAQILRSEADGLVSSRRLVGSRIYEQPALIVFEGRQVGRMQAKVLGPSPSREWRP